MASNDLFLRSDADKNETSVDNDLRLRSDTDKTTVVVAAATEVRQVFPPMASGAFGGARGVMGPDV